MKNYNILDNFGNITAYVQVDDAISVDQLHTIYGGTIVETNNIFVPTVVNDASFQIRSLRNRLLGQIDAISAVWFSTLTAQKQQELQAYRQALLDVPQQAGFPATVEWPAKPGWL